MRPRQMPRYIAESPMTLESGHSKPAGLSFDRF